MKKMIWPLVWISLLISLNCEAQNAGLRISCARTSPQLKIETVSLDSAGLVAHAGKGIIRLPNVFIFEEASGDIQVFGVEPKSLEIYRLEVPSKTVQPRGPVRLYQNATLLVEFLNDNNQYYGGMCD